MSFYTTLLRHRELPIYFLHESRVTEAQYAPWMDPHFRHLIKTEPLAKAVARDWRWHPEMPRDAWSHMLGPDDCRGEDDMDCMVCLDAVPNTCLVPCMHRVLCHPCVEALAKTKKGGRCLYCQRPSVGVLVVEWADVLNFVPTPL